MKYSLLKVYKSVLILGLGLIGIITSSNVNAQTKINLIGNDTICNGDSLKAFATSTRLSGVRYSWSDTTSFATIHDTITNDTAWLKPPGDQFTTTPVTHVYRVIGDSSGVMDTAYQVITIYPLPTTRLSVSEDTVCVGDTITLKGSGTVVNGIGLDFKYYRGSNIIGSGDSAFAIVSADDSLWVSGTNVNGCSSTAGVKIFTKALPTVAFGMQSNGYPSDQFFACAGQNFTLEATSGHASYTWSSNAQIVSGQGTNTVVGNTSSSVLYNVSVVGTNGCTTNASRLVRTTVQPGSFVTLNLQEGNLDTVLCGGESRTGIAARCDYYTWSPASAVVGGNVNAATVTLRPAASTTVSVEGAFGGCVTTASIDLIVSPVPTLSLVSQTSSAANPLCLGEADSIEISSTSNMIQWNTIRSASKKKAFTYPRTTTFKIIASNSVGCAREITVTSHVDTTCGKLSTNEIYETNLNAFYNADSKQFVLNTSNEVVNAQVAVYDLSGNTVFNTQIELEQNNTLEFDLSGLSSGAYLFRVSNDRLNYHKKFIKQ